MACDHIVLGLWPIAGVTTIGVTPDDARRTLVAAIDAGVTRFDTAYSYGFDGESDRLLGEQVRSDRDRFTIMGKVGQRWDGERKRVVDGSPKQLTRDAEESLRRMKIDCMDVLFLHAPDPEIEIGESAAAMQRLKTRGLCRRVGICNASAAEIEQFASVVDTKAIQCPLNLIQRDQQTQPIADAAQAGREVYVFWTLMKGLLAGKITRNHRFQEGDSRPGYPIFQGDTRRRVHDVIDRLQELGRRVDLTVAQIAVSWAFSQPGVTAALVGARRPEQILETLGARRLEDELVEQIDRIVRLCFAADDESDASPT